MPSPLNASKKERISLSFSAQPMRRPSRCIPPVALGGPWAGGSVNDTGIAEVRKEI